MSRRRLRVAADSAGLQLPPRSVGRHEVVFDGTPIWSFEPEHLMAARKVRRRGRKCLLVGWPSGMRRWLTGRTHLVVRTPTGEADLGEVVFDDTPERVEFVDEHGFAVVIDKWGIPQRPFSVRDPGVTAAVTEATERIIAIAATQGIELWMAFGTLLGAAREGRAIGHDSDVDLAYLSDQETPAQMMAELYRLRRALVADGLRVVNKSGSFLTVVADAPDGTVGVDIYTTFYLSGLLHETATVRAPVPREAVLPLQRLSFEGRELPAPADPELLLTASYGPGWRTPDPSFHHRPTEDLDLRFDGWFGRPMRERRHWENYWAGLWRPEHEDSPDFLDWATPLVPDGADLIDLGAGRAADAVHFAERGHRAVALDYARGAFGVAIRHPELRPPQLVTHLVNLYDARDTLSMGALLARRSGTHRVLLARHLFDAMDAYGRAHVWQFAAMVLAVGGEMLIEVDCRPKEYVINRFAHIAGRRFPVEMEQLEAGWTRAGGTLVDRTRIPTPPGLPEYTERWRIVIGWPGRDQGGSVGAARTERGSQG